MVWSYRQETLEGVDEGSRRCGMRLSEARCMRDRGTLLPGAGLVPAYSKSARTHAAACSPLMRQMGTPTPGFVEEPVK